MKPSSRRQFLTTASAAGAIAIAAPFARAAEREPIGCGQIGTRHAHASGKMEAMRQLTQDFRVVGIVEANEKARAAAEKNKSYAGLSFLDEAELLGDRSVQVVAIETTLEDSTTTARRVIAVGKHLHLDKPGGADHAAFKTMRQEAEDRGLIVQMGYMLRHQPGFQLLFDLMREEALGEIQEITATMGKQASAGLRKELAAIPGHGMFELGCHLVDAVVTLLGPPPKIIASSARSLSPADELPDHQLAVFEYPRALVTLRCNHNDPGGGGRRAFTVVGSKGSLELHPLELGRGTLTLSKPFREYVAGENKLTLAQPRGRYDAEFVALSKWIRGEEKCPWNAAHDIAVQEAALKAAGCYG